MYITRIAHLAKTTSTPNRTLSLFSFLCDALQCIACSLALTLMHRQLHHPATHPLFTSFPLSNTITPIPHIPSLFHPPSIKKCHSIGSFTHHTSLASRVSTHSRALSCIPHPSTHTTLPPHTLSLSFHVNRIMHHGDIDSLPITTPSPIHSSRCAAHERGAYVWVSSLGERG